MQRGKNEEKSNVVERWNRKIKKKLSSISLQIAPEDKSIF